MVVPPHYPGMSFRVLNDLGQDSEEAVLILREQLPFSLTRGIVFPFLDVMETSVLHNLFFARL